MNKKTKRLYAKLIILILCFCILVRIFTLALSKYRSEADSIAEVDIAFYLLSEDYKTMTLNLDSLFPQDNVYVYTFSIGNQEGKKKAEVDIEYELSLRTTTNLPLTYKLYMNEEYNKKDAKDIIQSNEIYLDEDGTYFRKMTTQKMELKYTEPTTNIYQLVISFPSNYNTENYQDIIEAIEISIDGKQII